ncbi:MAG: FKBP-type peptidyl-prolyl cis-trans isomerase N-terminal domain-containing protein [Paludibacter sp.]|nr:FKBP-type peptidyl-prolyl cis-trans isomerase N-terminal domain-containing protein [Paludibacter sp.]
MKKFSPFLIVATALAIFSFSSCNDIKPKSVSLETVNDSINYTLGQWQGEMIRAQQFAGDSTGVQAEAFIKALDKAYNKKGDDNAMYSLGVQVGKYFADQSRTGLFGDSTMTVNDKMLLQGFVNALKDYQEVMTGQQADSLLQAAQMRIQSKMYGQPNN